MMIPELTKERDNESTQSNITNTIVHHHTNIDNDVVVAVKGTPHEIQMSAVSASDIEAGGKSTRASLTIMNLN